MARYGRRSAFKAAGALGFGMVTPRGAAASDASGVLSFYVAGARFRRDVDLAEGRAVVLRRTTVGGRDAYEVVEPSGQVLGYVPSVCSARCRRWNEPRLESSATSRMPCRGGATSSPCVHGAADEGLRLRP